MHSASRSLWCGVGRRGGGVSGVRSVNQDRRFILAQTGSSFLVSRRLGSSGLAETRKWETSFCPACAALLLGMPGWPSVFVGRRGRDTRLGRQKLLKELTLEIKAVSGTPSSVLEELTPWARQPTCRQQSFPSLSRASTNAFQGKASSPCCYSQYERAGASVPSSKQP